CSTSCSRSMRGPSSTCDQALSSRSSTDSSAPGSRRPATPASRVIRWRTASAPARTSRLTHIRPAAAPSRRGWSSRSSPGSIGPNLGIARGLDALGIERIEAGFPRVSADDERAFRLVLAAGLDAEIWGFSRAVPADIEALVELGVSASVVESPISDLKLEALGVTREEMLGRVLPGGALAAPPGIQGH